MKTSLTFFPNEAKKNKIKATIPLYIRIGFKREKADNRLNFEITERDLPLWDPFTMRLQGRNLPVNHYLNRIEQKFQEFLIMNATSLHEYSAATIRDAILGLNKKSLPTVMEFVDKYFEEAVLNNSNLMAGTTKVYRMAINHFRKFLTIRSQQNLTMDRLDYELASAFKNFLVTKNLSLNMIGMKEVSAAGIIKKFRKIFTHAFERGLISKNPFKQVKIIAKSPRIGFWNWFHDVEF